MSSFQKVSFESIPKENEVKVPGTCGNCIHSGLQARTYTLERKSFLHVEKNTRYGFPFTGCHLLPNTVVKDVDDWCSYQSDKDSKDWTEEELITRSQEAQIVEEEIQFEFSKKSRPKSLEL